MTKEPRVPKSMVCALPDCGKPLPRSKQSRKYAGSVLEGDPFCSTVCCRQWWGTELPPPTPGIAVGAST